VAGSIHKTISGLSRLLSSSIHRVPLHIVEYGSTMRQGLVNSLFMKNYRVKFYGALLFAIFISLGYFYKENLLAPSLVEAQTAGTTYYVAKTGNNSNPGSSASPFLTVQKAADVVQPGDIVVVRPGVYKERIIMKTSGTASSPIIFRGEPGAIIDGGDSFPGKWSLAPGYDPSLGVYRLAFSDAGYNGVSVIPNHTTWQDKYITHVHYYNQAQGDYYNYALNMLGQPASASVWDGLEAISVNVQQGGNFVYLRFRHPKNPNNENVTIAPLGRGAFELSNKHFVNIEGFLVKNAYHAVLLTDGSSNNVISKNTLTNGSYTLAIKNGAAKNHIRDNEVTLNFIYPDIGHPRLNNPSAANAIIGLRVMTPISTNIYLSDAGPENQVYRNHIFRTLAAGLFLQGSRTEEGFNGRETKIYGNKFEYCTDYCVLVSGPSTKIEINDNSFYEYYAGMRFGPMSGNGPLYIYRNTFQRPTLALDNGDFEISYPRAPTNPTTFPSGGAFFYHNSFSGNAFALSLFGQNIANSYFINNIFSSAYLAATGCNSYGGSTAGGYDCTSPNPSYFDHNWVGGVGAVAWRGSNNKVFPGVRIWGSGNTNFILPDQSTAVNMGLDLSKPWVANGKTFPALPGMTSGYFSGSAPDAGAFELGTSASPTPTPTPTSSSGSTTFYVSTDGNDLNSGTISQPLRNIITAMKKMNPGDTTIIRGGTYDRFTPVGFNITSWGSGYDVSLYNGSSIKSGTPTARMTLKAYPGEQVILTSDPRLPAGHASKGDTAMMTFEGTSGGPSYWTLEGLTFLLGRRGTRLGDIYGVYLSARYGQINGMIIRNNVFKGGYRQGIDYSQQYTHFGGHVLTLDAWTTPGGVKGALIEGNSFEDYPSTQDVEAVLLQSSVFAQNANAKPNEDVVIRNNFFHGIGADGIHLDSTGHKNTLIEGNTLIKKNWGSSHPFFQEENAMDIKYGSGGWTIVRNNTMSGYRPKSSGGSAAIVIHQAADDVIIEGNRIFDSGMGIRAAQSGPRYGCGPNDPPSQGEMCWFSGETLIDRIKIRRNLIVGTTEADGAVVGDGKGTGQAIRIDALRDFEISHNIIALTSGEGILGAFNTGVISNNIFYRTGRAEIDERTGAVGGQNQTNLSTFVVGPNIFFNPSGEKISYIGANGNQVIGNLSSFQSRTGKAAGSLALDPLFINPTLTPTTWNYQLQATSPAIDKAIRIMGVNDTFTGSAPDIGAYEYGATGGTNPTPTPSTSSGPTPTSTPAPACTLYTPASTIPTGFASPYNVVNNPNQSMMNASCSTSGQSITLGTGNQLTYIYKTGYVLRNNAWQPVNYTGSNLLYSNWYAGNASGSLNLTQAELTQGTYFLSYQCQWTPSTGSTSLQQTGSGQAGAWKCGCRTAACSGAEGNKWQIQFVKQ
jgi:hypothetical protein